MLEGYTELQNTGIQVRSLGQEDPLEKGMATPVFLPEEFHGQRSLVDYIQFIGLDRVGHD